MCSRTGLAPFGAKLFFPDGGPGAPQLSIEPQYRRHSAAPLCTRACPSDAEGSLSGGAGLRTRSLLRPPAALASLVPRRHFQGVAGFPQRLTITLRRRRPFCLAASARQAGASRLDASPRTPTITASVSVSRPDSPARPRPVSPPSRRLPRATQAPWGTTTLTTTRDLFARAAGGASVSPEGRLPMAGDGGAVKVVVLTTSYPRHEDDVAGSFVRDAVEHVRAAGVRGRGRLAGALPSLRDRLRPRRPEQPPPAAVARARAARSSWRDSSARRAGPRATRTSCTRTGCRRGSWPSRRAGRSSSSSGAATSSSRGARRGSPVRSSAGPTPWSARRTPWPPLPASSVPRASR